MMSHESSCQRQLIARLPNAVPGSGQYAHVWKWPPASPSVFENDPSLVFGNDPRFPGGQNAGSCVFLEMTHPPAPTTTSEATRKSFRQNFNAQVFWGGSFLTSLTCVFFPQLLCFGWFLDTFRKNPPETQGIALALVHPWDVMLQQ